MARRRAFNAGGELISKTIDSVLQGVSQEPPTVRLPGRCEEQINLMSDAASGTKRRAPSEHIAALDGPAFDDVAFTLPAEKYKVHFRDRDEETQHVILLEDGDIRVFRLRDGVEATVTGATTYLNIAGTDASAAFAITSVADYSFIVNKETTVTMSAATTAARINQFMIHWIESGESAARDWRHDLGALSGDNATNPLNTGTENTDPGKMIENLITDIYDGVGGNYPLWDEGIETSRNVVLVVQADESGDGVLSIHTPSYEYSDEVYAFIGLQTQRFSDLPAQGVDNFITEITGADGNQDNNYWVVFDSSLSAWVETVAPGIPYTFTGTTMPHVLINTLAYSDSTPDVFTFGPQAWANREKGDEDSAPAPTFVGKPISDIFFHKNRLGVLAGESVVLSEAGEFFNFWPTTVTTIIDSDPIDAASTNNRVALLDHAIPFDHKLYMFSGHGAVQNVLAGGDTMTAQTAEVTEASAYPSSVGVKPVASGKSIYFVVDRGVSSSIYDYTVEDNSPDGWNLTAHVPTYVPPNLTSLSLSPKEDILSMLSSDAIANLYINNFNYNARGEKVQNSWSKWVFDDSYTILGQGWIGEILYLVVYRADGLHLEKINVATLVDGDLDHRTHLDSLVELTGVYTVEDNLTRWTVPYYIDPASYGDHRVVLTGVDFGDDLGKVMPLAYEAGTDVVVTAEGDWSTDSAHIGRTYTHTYEFTKPVITAPDESGQNKVSVTQGRLQITRFKVLCKTSAGFYAKVSSSEVNPEEVLDAEGEYVYNFPGKILNAGTVSVIHPRPVSEFPFDVGMESKYARIQIIGDSHLPFVLVGAEWEANYSVRSSRI
jgi:hypothetical protein